MAAPDEDHPEPTGPAALPKPREPESVWVPFFREHMTYHELREVSWGLQQRHVDLSIEEMQQKVRSEYTGLVVLIVLDFMLLLLAGFLIKHWIPMLVTPPEPREYNILRISALLVVLLFLWKCIESTKRQPWAIRKAKEKLRACQERLALIPGLRAQVEEAKLWCQQHPKELKSAPPPTLPSKPEPPIPAWSSLQPESPTLIGLPPAKVPLAPYKKKREPEPSDEVRVNIRDLFEKLFPNSDQPPPDA